MFETTRSKMTYFTDNKLFDPVEVFLFVREEEIEGIV